MQWTEARGLGMNVVGKGIQKKLDGGSCRVSCPNKQARSGHRPATAELAFRKPTLFCSVVFRYLSHVIIDHEGLATVILSFAKY
jgi:hypothetical protein